MENANPCPGPAPFAAASTSTAVVIRLGPAAVGGVATAAWSWARSVPMSECAPFLTAADLTAHSSFTSPGFGLAPPRPPEGAPDVGLAENQSALDTVTSVETVPPICDTRRRDSNSVLPLIFGPARACGGAATGTIVKPALLRSGAVAVAMATVGPPNYPPTDNGGGVNK